jgi:adenylate cyclase
VATPTADLGSRIEELWPQRRTPIHAWLVHEAQRLPTAEHLLEQLGQRLIGEGVPLFRATFNLLTLHPQLRAVSLIWRRDRAGVETLRVEHGVELTDRYLNSPIRILFEGAAAVRQRLDIPGAPLPFPIYEELRQEGATDYVAMPLVFSDGRSHGSTWATDRPGGFTSEHLALIYDLLPLVVLILEARLTRRIARNLLETYVGLRSGERILNGEIRRGTGETLEAAIWYCDLRGFTAMSETLPGAELIATLNAYFERMAGPVETEGGEVLKFMGDGMLAVFPVDQADAHCRAFAAAEGAIAGMAALNRERETAGLPSLGFGIALHAGEVVYGNIGAPNRLDFTVIGPAVNQAVRIEALCRELGRPLLVSAAFRASCPLDLVSLGRFGLRGVREPAEVFALREAA